MNCSVMYGVRCRYTSMKCSVMYGVRCRYTSMKCSVMYSGTSLIRSLMGLGKSDLNGEVTVLQGAQLHCGIQYGTAQG